ncbi:MAG: MFS transporter [Desulfobacteraceae bacterium]|nr:MAG: MFS transporter [Desulfobacteraceae bacterium]
MNKEPEFSLLSKDFILICLANFCYFGSFYILVPAMPQYVVSLGGTTGQVGIIMGLFTFSSVVVRPYFGNTADVRGRKSIMLLGSGFFVLSPLMYMAVNSLIPLYLARIAHGFAHAAYLVAAMAYIADMAPPHRRGEVIGIFGVANILGMAVFPAWGTHVLSSGGSFQYLFFLGALTALVSVIAILLVDDIRPPAHSAVKSRGFMKVGTRPAVLIPSIALLSGATCYGAVLTFLPLFAPQRGLPDFGIFFIVYSFSTILSRVLGGRLSDRIGRRKVIIPCMVLLAFSICLLPFLHTIQFLAVVSFLFGLSFGSFMPTLNALVVDHTAPHERGSALAFFMSFMDVGITVGSMALGFVAEGFGYPAVYWICGALVLATMLIFTFFLPRGEKGPTEERLPLRQGEGRKGPGTQEKTS